MSLHPATAPLYKHLSIFTGVMGFGIIYIMWASTYFFSWYGLYDNPQDLKKMRGDFIFLTIAGAFMMAPLCFFVMGFVSTFSLVHNNPEGEKMSFIHALKFIAKRIIKLAPFNIFVVGFGACIGPIIGAGPFWDLYIKTMKPCETLWWTNLFFINNFYPSTSFEDKCMGWTWFVPCYVQLTLVLPILIAVFENLPRIASTIIFSAMGLGSIIVNFILINGGDFGIFLTFDNDGTHFNTQFLNELFMKPYFHFSAYLWGVILCLAYVRYAREKSGLIPADVANNSLSSRAFAFFKSNHLARYVLYAVAFTITSLTYFSLHGYL